MANRSILIGLLAGLAAGLLVTATVTTMPFAFFLPFVAAGVIYIATMGWGFQAGIASVIAGTGTIGAFTEISTALAGSAMLFVPAGWVGHLTNLGQTDEDRGGIRWYPLGTILFHLMAILVVVFITIGALGGVTEEALVNSFKQLFSEVMRQRPDMSGLTPEVIETQARAYATVIPLVAPGVWLLMHVLTAFAAAAITRRSGILAREREDIAASVALPPQAAGFLVAGLVGMLVLSGSVALAGAVMLGIAICGYGLIGLAQLHFKLRGNPAAFLVLTIAYGSVILLAFPFIVFTIMGLLRSFSQQARNTPGHS
ncbi:MAG: hypothetical protein M9908_08180 [Phyllobacteriaceae bacterium]|nr:hypothetical protein [Phyllobacteriaceae bacterium]